MKRHAAKLIELIERNPNEIAKQWSRSVKKNARTPSFHDIPESDLIPIAIDFYSRFGELFSSQNPFETCQKVFGKYAEDRYHQGIPLEETIYAMILMKRHIWLYAEFQALFTSALEQQQATESLNRTILMFDYAIYVIAEKYQFLMQGEVDNKIGAISKMFQKGDAKKYQYATIAVLVIAAAALTYYSHAVVGTGTLFTHLFYIPIVFASVWFLSRGIIVSVLLAVLLLVSHFIFLQQASIVDDLIRAIMFVSVGMVVAKLTTIWSKRVQLNLLPCVKKETAG